MLLEILNNGFINVFKTSHFSKIFDIRLRIPTPDVEAEINVSERKQVKFRSGISREKSRKEKLQQLKTNWCNLLHRIKSPCTMTSKVTSETQL